MSFPFYAKKGVIYIPGLIFLAIVVKYWKWILAILAFILLCEILSANKGENASVTSQDHFIEPHFSKSMTSGVYSSDNPYTPLPQWGSSEYVQGICARNLIDAMNTASSRCLSNEASAYKAYQMCTAWIQYHDRYLDYTSRYHPRTIITIKSTRAEILARLDHLTSSYATEEAEIVLIRNNLKSYLSIHPHGYRKDAINAHARKSNNPRLYNLYRAIFQEFSDSGFLYTHSSNGVVEYEYFGHAVKLLLDSMQHIPSGRRKDILKQLCPEKNSTNRKMLGYAMRFMEDAHMIEIGKDDKGFITYSFISSIPHQIPHAPRASKGLDDIHAQDTYLINKALYSVNAPAFLDRERQIADFVSLTSNSFYHTSLYACTCPAFEGNRTPCKHMIRLAIELNLFNPPGSQYRYSYKPEQCYSSNWFTNFL